MKNFLGEWGALLCIGLAIVGFVGYKHLKATAVSHANTTQSLASCDPNYTGACVPNVYPEDVDCAGGSGNGPYYVQGPVHVVGEDRYGLDADGDGIGCE